MISLFLEYFLKQRKIKIIEKILIKKILLSILLFLQIIDN